MQSLTPDQAQQLWQAGGFLVVRDLPEGSEFGIDGTFHLVRRFSGYKFLPPGLHMITWAAPSSPSATAGPSAIPVRSARLRTWASRQRVVLRYDPASEDMVSEDAIISDDHLRTLDKEMAPYPFARLEAWKALTGHVSAAVIRDVLEEDGRSDGMMQVQGEKDESSEISTLREALPVRAGTAERKMSFAHFDLKRSWPPGSVGEDLTRNAQDKSWLFGHVVKEQCHGDPYVLLGQLQLAFVLLLQLSSYSALLVYKRVVAAFCQSSDLLADPNRYLDPRYATATAQNGIWSTVLDTFSAQLRALPDTAFDAELPEMDVFLITQLESIRSNLSGKISLQPNDNHKLISSAWTRLRDVASQKFGWQLPADIGEVIPSSDLEELEEGEDAPVVVDA